MSWKTISRGSLVLVSKRISLSLSWLAEIEAMIWLELLSQHSLFLGILKGRSDISKVLTSIKDILPSSLNPRIFWLFGDQIKSRYVSLVGILSCFRGTVR